MLRVVAIFALLSLVVAFKPTGRVSARSTLRMDFSKEVLEILLFTVFPPFPECLF